MLFEIISSYYLTNNRKSPHKIKREIKREIEMELETKMEIKKRNLSCKCG